MKTAKIVHITSSHIEKAMAKQITSIPGCRKSQFPEHAQSSDYRHRQ